MAERRMFAKTIIDSDAFLDMPTSARLLYYDLSMRADDDGFINSPKKIIRMTGAAEDDLKVLIIKKFVIPFENGVVVIKHWFIHNYIRKDTYNETPYKQEKAMLLIDENKSYKLISEESVLPVDEASTQVRLGKVRLGKDSLNNIPASEDKSSSASVKANDIVALKEKELQSNEKKAKASKHKYGKYQNVLLKDEELQELKEKYDNWEELISFLDEYIEMKGYKAKSHYLCIKKWVVDAVKKEKAKKSKTKCNFEQRSYDNYDKLYANKQN